MSAARGRGRPPLCPPDVLARIILMHRAGKRYIDICTELNAEGVPTPARRSNWSTSHVCNLLYTLAAQRMRIQLDAQPRAWLTHRRPAAPR